MTEVLYTYAFFAVPPQETATRLHQIQGLSESIQVFVPEHSPIAAAIEPLGSLSDLESSDETLLRSALRHDQVICQLFAQLHVLPLRFGTCFVSSDKLQAHLLARQSDYQQTLASLRGRAEYLLKAVVAGSPDPSSVSEEILSSPSGSSGTAYLVARKQAFLRQQQWAQQIQQETEQLQQLWSQHWPQHATPPQGEETLRQYFLLSLDQYRQALELSHTWMEDHGHWHLDWSTALPPYHFVQPSQEPEVSLS